MHATWVGAERDDPPRILLGLHATGDGGECPAVERPQAPGTRRAARTHPAAHQDGGDPACAERAEERRPDLGLGEEEGLEPERLETPPHGRGRIEREQAGEVCFGHLPRQRQTRAGERGDDEQPSREAFAQAAEERADRHQLAHRGRVQPDRVASADRRLLGCRQRTQAAGERRPAAARARQTRTHGGTAGNASGIVDGAAATVIAPR